MPSGQNNLFSPLGMLSNEPIYTINMLISSCAEEDNI